MLQNVLLGDILLINIFVKKEAAETQSWLNELKKLTITYNNEHAF